MRRILCFLLLLLALLTSQTLLAQAPPDQMDEKSFLILLAMVMISVCLGLMLTGFLASMLLLIITIAMTSAGIISTAIVVGLYKKSVSAGFKTLFTLASAIGGAVVGIAGLFFINEIFSFHFTRSTIAWAGLAGGLIGGILLALIIIHIIRIVLARVAR